MMTYTDVTIVPPPKPVGYWRIDPLVLVAIYKRPNWWKQLWVGALLGWCYVPEKGA